MLFLFCAFGNHIDRRDACPSPPWAKDYLLASTAGLYCQKHEKESKRLYEMHNQELNSGSSHRSFSISKKLSS